MRFEFVKNNRDSIFAIAAPVGQFYVAQDSLVSDENDNNDNDNDDVDGEDGDDADDGEDEATCLP